MIFKSTSLIFTTKAGHWASIYTTYILQPTKMYWVKCYGIILDTIQLYAPDISNEAGIIRIFIINRIVSLNT